ncbi:MAG: hypothetical protein FJ221_10995 [Lentisphaerae bacterium]|nr:hypothetical protein [Lentisphaerota bacterium]
MRSSYVRSILVAAVAAAAVAAEPEFRTWTSVSGAKVEARLAGTAPDGAAILELRDGRRVRIQAASLTEADRALLAPGAAAPEPAAPATAESKPAGEEASPAKKPAASKTTKAKAPAIPMEPTVPPSGYGTSGQPLQAEWPLGQVVTNIPCRGDETMAFHLYLPRGLQQGRKYPVLFLCGTSSGKATAFARYLDGAELNGFILAMPSVGASENFDRAMTSMQATISNVLARVPADPRRLYASGFSDSSRVAILAATEWFGHPAAGVLLSGVGGGSDEMAKLPKSAAVAGLAASASVLRWDIACTVYKYSKTKYARAFFFPGRTDWGSPALIADAMTWMNACQLRDEKGGRPEIAREREALVKSILDRVEPALDARPGWAAEWIEFLQDFPGLGPLQGRVRTAAQKLEKIPAAAAQLKAVPEVEKFARKHFATSPKAYRKDDANGTPEAKRDADALLAKFKDAEIAAVITEFGAAASTGGGH